MSIPWKRETGQYVSSKVIQQEVHNTTYEMIIAPFPKTIRHESDQASFSNYQFYGNKYFSLVPS